MTGCNVADLDAMSILAISPPTTQMVEAGLRLTYPQ